MGEDSLTLLVVSRLETPMLKGHSVSISDEIERRLETERKRRGFESMPETIRVVLSEYLSRG